MIDRHLTCRHCGNEIRAGSVHDRLHRGPREAHDRKIRESEAALAAGRAVRDRDYAFDVIRRGAAARGNAFPFPIVMEMR